MKTILVAEDDPFLAKMYQLNLAQEGREVRCVSNGEEAIAYLKQHTPDILLLDLLMPKVDGFAVLEYLQEHEKTFPIIILSNISQEMDQKKCIELGAKEYFVKSDVDLEVLNAKVQQYL